MSEFDEKFWLHKVYQICHLDGIGSDKYETLNYYRDLVEKGELERAEWLSKHESVRVKQALVHKLEWELKTRKEEISELESQLKSREEALNQGREDLMRLAKENEELITSQQTDRDNLTKLMDKTEAIHQDIFISEGQKPNTVYSYGSQSSCKNLRPKHIVRTLHLPCPQNQEISKIKEDLTRHLEEQRKFYYDKIAEEREKGRKLEYDLRVDFEENGRTISSLIDKLKKAQTGKLAAIKDFFLLRHQYETREMDLIKTHQLLREKIDSIIKETIDSKANNEKQLKNIQKQAHVKAVDYAHEFRQQANTAKDSYEQINDQYLKLKQVYFDKTRELEEKHYQMNKKFSELKNRKHLETQGLKTMIKNLEEKIDMIENPPRKIERNTNTNKKPCERCLEKNIKN